MDISSGVWKAKCRTRALQLLGEIAKEEAIPELDGNDYLRLIEDL